MVKGERCSTARTARPASPHAACEGPCKQREVNRSGAERGTTLEEMQDNVNQKIPKVTKNQTANDGKHRDGCMTTNIATNCRRQEGKLSQSEMRQRITEMRMRPTSRTLRLLVWRVRRMCSTVQSTRRNIDFNIPGVPNSTVKRSHGVNVQNLMHRIENHPQRQALQSDLQQHRPLNPFSKESQDVIKKAGNTELCEILDVEPKAQCKACLAYWDAGIVYCTCGHFLRDDTTENKKCIKSVLDLFSIPNFYIRKGRPHGHRYGKKEGDQEYHTANQLQKKCKKRQFLSIHDRFIRDTWFPKTMLELGRTEEVIREMDKLANEDHTHIATEEELNVYRSNWWIRLNFVGSDTMPIRHRPDFKEALSTLRRIKNAEDQAYYQNWWQRSSSSWWQRQDSWWNPSSETSPRRWT